MPTLGKIFFVLIQIATIKIAFKPLVRLGLDFPFLVRIKDARIKDFNQSLLAITETTLLKESVYFDCFPNLLLDCQHDSHVHEALTVHIQTK